MKPALIILICIALTALGAAEARATDWPMYGFDLKRDGYNPEERTLGPKNVATLQLIWARKLGSGITAQPVVADHVRSGGKSKELVYVGSEHGDFVALDASTGKIAWRRRLGVYRDTTCPEDTPDGNLGVTGTAAIDRPAGVVYAVGGNNKAYAFDLATGAVRPGWPVSLGLDPRREHVWSGLTLSNGQLYISSASDGCDTLPYHGRLIRIDVRTKSTSVWYPASSPDGTLQGAGIWSAAGLSVDPTSNDLLVATGNDVGKDESARFGEHVARLHPWLSVVASNHPAVKGFDVDFGSTPVLFTAPGCPQEAIVENKAGIIVLYRAGAIGAGPVQTIKISSYVPGGELIGSAAYSPTTKTVFVTSPTDLAKGRYVHGLLAFEVGKNCKLSLRWNQTASKSGAVTSSPTVANGVVYYGDGPGNELRALNAATGTPLWESNMTIGGPVFGAPSVVNGRVFVGSWDGRIYAFAPRKVPSAETNGGGGGGSSRSWIALVGIAAAAATANMLRRIRNGRRRAL